MLLDIAFFGPGLVIPVLGISLRRTLFALILLVLCFRRLISSRIFTNDEVAFLTLLAAFALFWGMVIPYSYGYVISQSFADISPWLGLLILALWPWDAWPAEAQWKKFCGFLIWIAVLLAIVHLGIWALLVSNIVSAEAFAITANLVSANGEGDSFLRLVPLDNGQYRVFWSSSIFLLGGIYFLSVSRKSSNTGLWISALALACFALAATYIRAFLGALAIFAVASVLLRRLYKSTLIKWPIATVLALWVAAIVSVSVAISPAVLGALGLARDASDVERVEQSTALLAQFNAHPILGTGFGSYVHQVIRAAEAPFSYELVFYALLMKLGIIGILVLLLVLAAGLKVALAQDMAIHRPDNYAIWLAFTTGLWFAGATNPMVTNFVGMTIVVLLLVDMRVRSSATPPLSVNV